MHLPASPIPGVCPLGPISPLRPWGERRATDFKGVIFKMENSRKEPGNGKCWVRGGCRLSSPKLHAPSPRCPGLGCCGARQAEPPPGCWEAERVTGSVSCEKCQIPPHFTKCFLSPHAATAPSKIWGRDTRGWCCSGLCTIPLLSAMEKTP